MSEYISLLIAFFSAIATGFAAYAAWQSPISAAKLAEKLRLDNERQKQKMYIFSTLMQERAQIYSDNSVRALNLIDVVFNESREVREMWSELFLAFHMQPLVQHVIDERLRKLLNAIAKDIGLSDGLRTDDLGRVYYPTVKAQEQFIRDMQRQQLMTSLQGQNAASASQPITQNNPWPPKP